MGPLTVTRATRRALGCLAVCALLSAFPAPALAQAGGGVDELWQQYPLEQREPQGSAAEGATPPAPRAARRDAGEAGAGIGAAVLVPVGLALVGLLALGAARLALARRRRAAYARWLRGSRDFVSGSTDRDGIGAFSGYVHAHRNGTTARPERMLFVRDPERESPVWVLQSEVADVGPPPADAVREPEARRGGPLWLRPGLAPAGGAKAGSDPESEPRPPRAAVSELAR